MIHPRVRGILARLPVALLLSLLLTVAAWAPALGSDKKQKPPEEDSEVKLGRENAAENDKSVKLITDAALLDRVNKIGQQIAAVANKEEVPAGYGTSNVKVFNYQFKIVDDKDVNAYSLPGGFIYLNKGLIDYVHSDDELAGVVAHEISHAAHHHMMKLIHEQNKLQRNLILPILVVALATKAGGQDVVNLINAGQIYMVAKLNSYGVEAEKDADHTAVEYLTKTKYNPVGLLTFMERLARDELRSPDRDLGIFKTHPPSPERAASLLTELQDLNIPINRRDADPNLSAQIKTASVNGVELAEVTMNKVVVARMAPADGLSAQERAKRLSDTLNRLFDAGLQMYEVRLGGDKRSILARNQTVLAFGAADAAAQKATAEDLARNAMEAIKNLLWQDQFNRIPGEGKP